MLDDLLTLLHKRMFKALSMGKSGEYDSIGDEKVIFTISELYEILRPFKFKWWNTDDNEWTVLTPEQRKVKFKEHKDKVASTEGFKHGLENLNKIYVVHNV